MEAKSLLKEICIITAEANDVVVEEPQQLTNRLSFSTYLPDDELNRGDSQAYDSSSYSSAQIESTFEFFTTTTSNLGNNLQPAIIDQNEYQKRDYFANKSTPPPAKTHATDSPPNGSNNGLGHSISLPARSSSDVGRRRIVNFSSLTSMSAKSRRRMFMFGPVKFTPEMEIASIRQRQKAEPPRQFGVSGGGRSRSSASWQLTRVLGCMPLTAPRGFQ